jgi:transcription initiation factor TFIID subunit 1
LLDQADESPFLGDIEPGQSIQGFENNLFRAPVHKHNSAQTDFLLVKSKDGRKWYIREMGPVYAVGQIMPLQEVPAPNSRAANQYVKGRMQAFVYRSFAKKSNEFKRLRISDIYEAFPNQSDTAIRKRFKVSLFAWFIHS